MDIIVPPRWYVRRNNWLDTQEDVRYAHVSGRNGRKVHLFRKHSNGNDEEIYYLLRTQ